MAKKKVQKIPTKVILVCPHCKKGTKAIVSVEFSPQKYTCPKCKQEVLTPITSCCVVCAYSKSKTKYPRTLFMEAKAKNLEIKVV